MIIKRYVHRPNQIEYIYMIDGIVYVRFSRFDDDNEVVGV